MYCHYLKKCLIDIIIFLNIFKFQALQANFSKNSCKNLYFLKKYDESLVDISGESLIKVVNIGSQWNMAFQMFPRLDNGPPTEFTLFWSMVDLLRFFRSSYKSSYWFDVFCHVTNAIFFGMRHWASVHVSIRKAPARIPVLTHCSHHNSSLAAWLYLCPSRQHFKLNMFKTAPTDLKLPKFCKNKPDTYFW